MWTTIFLVRYGLQILDEFLKLNWMNLCNLIRKKVQLVLAIYDKIKTKNPLIISRGGYIIKSLEK
jgi:hypothetical protein